MNRLIGYSYSGSAEAIAQAAGAAAAAQAAAQAPAGYQYLANPASQLYPGLIGGYLGLGGGAGSASAPTPPPLIADPAYAKDDSQKAAGTLALSDSIFSAFIHAKRGILDLREGLQSAPTDKEKALIARISDYIDAHVTDAGELSRWFAPFLDNGAFALPDLDAVIDPGTTVAGADVPENDQSALFRTARIVTKDIRTTDALRYGLSMVRRARQRELESRLAELEALEADIPKAEAELAVLERARTEALGDYAVAQRLVAENWAAVEGAFAERKRILENNLGLYYVRVRETPLSVALPDPLALRYAGPDDIVPGCPLTVSELPEDLTPFMEAVLDVPVSDWAALAGLVQLLPGRGRMETLVQRRRQQLGLRLNQDIHTGSSRLALRLAPLRAQTLGLTRDLLARPFTVGGALSQVQQQGSQVLSLEDLLSGPPNRLRAQARTLHERLDAAAACLQGRLAALAPSIRLDWAGAAEDDRLPLENPARWPGLDRAEAADFNNLRTLVELVDWWFRQLAPGAAGASRTALRNFLRAALLLAAGDDPDQILQGSVSTVPGRFLPGARLRLTLNREALPGTQLQLLDAAQRVVGTLRVDDHDEQGALASVVRVLDPAARLATGLRVSGVMATLRL